MPCLNCVAADWLQISYPRWQLFALQNLNKGPCFYLPESISACGSPRMTCQLCMLQQLHVELGMVPSARKRLEWRAHSTLASCFDLGATCWQGCVAPSNVHKRTLSPFWRRISRVPLTPRFTVQAILQGSGGCLLSACNPTLQCSHAWIHIQVMATMASRPLASSAFNDLLGTVGNSKIVRTLMSQIVATWHVSRARTFVSPDQQSSWTTKLGKLKDRACSTWYLDKSRAGQRSRASAYQVVLPSGPALKHHMSRSPIQSVSNANGRFNRTL